MSGRRTFLALALACVAAVSVWLYADAGAPVKRIRVRWATGLSAEHRVRLEGWFHLDAPRLDEDGVWSYDALDTSRDMLSRIVRDPTVSDTQHVDRGAGTLSEDAPQGNRRIRTIDRLPLPGARSALPFLIALSAGLGLVAAWPVLRQLRSLPGMLRRLRPTMAAAALLFAATGVGLVLEDGRPAPMIRVSWREAVDAATRERLERALQLGDGHYSDGLTWDYYLLDDAPASVERLVRHPMVSDTHRVDREAFTIAPDATRGPARVRLVNRLPGIRAVPWAVPPLTLALFLAGVAGLSPELASPYRRLARSRSAVDVLEAAGLTGLAAAWQVLAAATQPVPLPLGTVEQAESTLSPRAAHLVRRLATSAWPRRWGRLVRAMGGVTMAAGLATALLLTTLVVQRRHDPAGAGDVVRRAMGTYGLAGSRACTGQEPDALLRIVPGAMTWGEYGVPVTSTTVAVSVVGSPYAQPVVDIRAQLPDGSRRRLLALVEDNGALTPDLLETTGPRGDITLLPTPGTYVRCPQSGGRSAS